MSTNKFDGTFEDWGFGKYTIESPDKKYVLWVSSGFLSFDDYYRSDGLLDGLSLWEQYLLWCEYKNEKRRRSIDSIKEYKND